MKLSLKIFLICFSVLSFSQNNKQPKANLPIEKNGFEININTKNLEKEKFIVYFVYGVKRQTVIVDSVTVKSNNQKITLRSKSKLLGSVYQLKLAKAAKPIEFAIDNNTQIDLTLEHAVIDSVKCTKHQLTKDFLNYQKTITNNKETNLTARNILIKKYPNTVLSLYFNIENKTYESPKDKSDKELLIYKNNFFKNFNKNDARLFLMPNFFRLLYNYVNIYPIETEYYNKGIDYLLNGLDCKSNNYKTIVNWYVSNLQFYESNNLDNSFVHLYKKYIDLEKCSSFDVFEMSAFKNKYQSILKLPYKSVFPNFTFQNNKAEKVSIAETYPKTDFTFVVFFSPNCKHCEENLPRNKQAFENLKTKYTNKSIQVISILNDEEVSKWEEFIKKAGIENWLNLKTIDGNMSFKENYSSYSNPTYFMLNKKGEIILKSFNLKAIEDLIAKN